MDDKENKKLLTNQVKIQDINACNVNILQKIVLITLALLQNLQPIPVQVPIDRPGHSDIWTCSTASKEETYSICKTPLQTIINDKNNLLYAMFSLLILKILLDDSLVSNPIIFSSFLS
jgi:hypothetical protein